MERAGLAPVLFFSAVVFLKSAISGSSPKTAQLNSIPELGKRPERPVM
jgi:hypothetical protein